MPFKGAEIYGAQAAAAAGVVPPNPISFWINAAQLTLDMVLGFSVKPGSMTNAPAPVSPAPVIGSGNVDPLLPDAAYALTAAAREGCPPTSSQFKFYRELAGQIRSICNQASVPGATLVCTPAGAITGVTTIVTAAPASAYAALAAAQAGVPPPAPKFWTDLAQVVITILGDGVVNPLGLIGNPAGGPVTGAGTVA